MVECYVSNNPFYSATMLQNATEQYIPGPRNADASWKNDSVAWTMASASAVENLAI